MRDTCVGCGICDLPCFNLPVSFSMLLITRGMFFESAIWGFVV